MGTSITNIARRLGWLKGRIRTWLLYAILCVLGLCQLGCAYAQLERATINERPVRKGESLGIEVTREDEQMTPGLGMELQKGDEIKTSPGVTALIRFNGVSGSEVIMMPETRITIESVFVWFGKVIVRAKGMFKSKTKDVNAGTKSTLYVMSVDRNDQSTVTMVEGSVLLSSNENRWPSRLLPSGQEARVLSSQAPVIKTMPREKYNSVVRFINKTTASIEGRKAGVIVPNVISMQQGKARSDLESAGLRVGKITKTIDVDEGYEIDDVVRQRPEPGKETKRGGSVAIEVLVRAVRVPSVIGQPRSAAMAAIREAGLIVDGHIPEKITGRYEPGVVIAQDPSAGHRVMEGTTVKLTVEAVSTEVPNVTGMPVGQGESRIREKGLTVRTTTSRLDPDIETPRIVGQDPAPGNRVRPGTTVTLRVANPGVRVPNLIGKNEKEAMSLLREANLGVGYVSRQYHDRYPAYVVTHQSTAAGQVVKPGSTVALTVSKGPEPKSQVPYLIGRHEREATSLLEKANLRVGYVTRQHHDKYPAGVVISQSPEARQLVKHGSAVNLTVSQGTPQTRVPSLIGRHEKEAINLLSQANLRVGYISRRESGRYRAGTVMEQSLNAGQLVRPGTVVNFTVSQGIL